MYIKYIYTVQDQTMQLMHSVNSYAVLYFIKKILIFKLYKLLIVISVYGSSVVFMSLLLRGMSGQTERHTHTHMVAWWCGG